MRNIVLLRDSLHELGLSGEMISITCEVDAELLVLSSHGEVHSYDLDTLELLYSYDLSGLVDDGEEDAGEEEDKVRRSDGADQGQKNIPDYSWFLMTILAESGALVCISHSGKIASIPCDPLNGRRESTPVLEGCIDTGIDAAAWSPDQSRIVFVTGGHTLLSMSSLWDVLDEVPSDARAPQSVCDVSWRGNGEQFALLSYDTEDCALGAKVRVYSKDLEFISVGCNIASGAGAVLKGVGSAASFATNGSLIACAQQRVPGKHQIAFLEKNGLRHGDFDVRLPASATVTGATDNTWEIVSLHWDLTSSVLAVGLQSVATGMGAIQLYYRGNYHWYLKQQWRNIGLHCLGFDKELLGRLYMGHRSSPGQGKAATASIRVVDFTWDVVCSTGKDASIAVIDGDHLLLTPLGRAVVPPPMSSFTAHLTGPCRHTSFWEPAAVATSGNGEDVRCKTRFSTGMLSVCDEKDGPTLNIHCLDERGTPMHPISSRRGSAPCANVSLRPLFREGDACVRAAQGCQYSVDRLMLCLLLHLNGQDHLACVTLSFPECTMISSPVFKALPGAALRIGAWPRTSATTSDSIALMFTDMEGSTACSVSRVYMGLGEEGAMSIVLGQEDEREGEFAFDQDSDNESNNSNDNDIQSEKKGRVGSLRLAEECMSMTVVCVNLPATADTAILHGSSARSVTLAIGLTSRNRLYCGETLVVSGASSYAVNTGLGILLYCSVGASPQLCFVPLAALAHIDPSSGIDAEDQLRPDFYAACYAPRPLERGARLVATVTGEPRVIVQQPRGNLEAFEPRALLLARARRLMDAARDTLVLPSGSGGEKNDKKETPEICEAHFYVAAELYLQCLEMLRRQRIDLNLLVDYRPKSFLLLAPALVSLCLQRAPSVLALLITCLTKEDVTCTKYPIPLTFGQQQAKFAKGEMWTSAEEPPYAVAEKVSSVSACLRVPLLDALRNGAKTALDPVLCTYARPSPPLLEEAIATIRAHIQTCGASAADRALTGSSGQAAIKYLAFLADGKQLFNAALGMCDFDAARAIARQCQMDPKVYLPLLERLEAPSRGFPLTSVAHAVTCVDVHVYLEIPDGIWKWGLHVLQRQLRDCCSAQDGTSNENNSIDTLDVTRITKLMLNAVKSGTLYCLSLPAIARLERQLACATPTPARSLDLSSLAASVCTLLSDTRVAHGEHQMKQLQPDYTEAISAFLSAEPPAVVRAIAAARQAEDWQMALSIAARHATTLTNLGETDLTPRKIAAEIVAELMVNLEQAGTFIDETGTDMKDAGIGEGNLDPRGDKLTQAAQLCVEYASDVDGAVRLLLLGRRFEQAGQLSLRHGRLDLLLDDVASTSIDAAEQLVAELRSRGGRVLVLNQRLREGPWADPVARLAIAMDAEPTLRKEIEWLDAGGAAISANEGGGLESDTQSEFSLASAARSDLSFISAMSGLSSASGMSGASGSTTVSVLSDLQTGIEKDKAARDRAIDKGSQFSISGLDHTLLSRGTGQEPTAQVAKNAEHARRLSRKAQKKSLRDEHKVRSKDSLGFTDEGRYASELWACSQILSFAETGAELCSVLQLLASPQAHRLAGQVQLALDMFTKLVRENPAPLAPMYSRAWLESKQMSHIRHFQEGAALAERDAKGDYSALFSVNWQGPEADQAKAAADKRRAAEGVVVSWWQSAAKGITAWHDRLRRNVLDIVDDKEKDSLEDN